MPRWVNQWDVPSSDGRRTYKVSLSIGDTWACSCRAWTTKMPRKDCKHIKAIKIVREQMNKNIVPNEPEVRPSKPAKKRKIMM